MWIAGIGLFWHHQCIHGESYAARFRARREWLRERAAIVAKLLALAQTNPAAALQAGASVGHLLMRSAPPFPPKPKAPAPNTVTVRVNFQPTPHSFLVDPDA